MVKAALLHWIANVPVGLAICILGIFGNVASICVWLRVIKKKLDGGTTTSLYLITLGIIDSFLLLFFMIVEIIPSANRAALQSYSFILFYCYIGFPLFYFFVVSSIWLLVGVTASRCIIVHIPIKARNLCSTVRTIWSVIIILACSFTINIPHFFTYAPKLVNGTYTLAETEYGKNGGAHHYEFWVHCMFLVLAPWGLISLMNISIIWSMKQRVKHSMKLFSAAQQKAAERKKQHDQITWMLLAVSFTFLVLLAGQCITQCLWMLGFNAGKPSRSTLDGVFAVAKLGIPINSSINWLLYCTTGSTFRKEVFKLFPSGSVCRRGSVVPIKEIGETQSSISIQVKSSRI